MPVGLSLVAMLAPEEFAYLGQEVILEVMLLPVLVVPPVVWSPR